MDNRENNDLRVANDNKPIEIGKSSDYNLGKDSSINKGSLEQKLNKKYTIKQKDLEKSLGNDFGDIKSSNTQKEELNKKNKSEYIINTLNIYNNNTIQINSRNKKGSEGKKTTENEINKNKEDGDKENPLEGEDIQKTNLKDKNDTKRNKNVHKKSVEFKDINCLTFSEKIKKNRLNYSHRESQKGIKDYQKRKSHSKSRKKSVIKEKEEDNRDSYKFKYSYTKHLSRNTEKINMLLKDIRQIKIDKILIDAPLRTKTTLEKLTKYLQKSAKNLTLIERALLVYKWVTDIIEYDFEGMNTYNYDTSEETTFNRGKSIYSGYARLYKMMCEKLELKVERIEGFSKGFAFNLNDNNEDCLKHEWNAIEIENEWYLIDPTWGAGYTTDEKTFIKKFNPYFFFTPPQEFVRGHLPFISKWQLLPKNKKVNHQTFMSFVPLKKDFFALGFNKIEPDFTFNDVKEKGQIFLYFEKYKEIHPENIKVMAKLFTKNDDNEEVKNSILEIKKEDCFEINYSINKKGDYILKIFGSDGSTKDYNELCILNLTTEKDIIRGKTYPTKTELYYSSDIKIINPSNGSLKEGTKVTFEFKTSNFQKLFLGVNTNEGENYIQMAKDNNNNIFKEEDFLIYGKKVIISSKGEKDNIFNTILEFDVIPITKYRNTITHPQVFDGPKNKLIEPICDRLKKGKKINFRLQSSLINEMAISDGDELHTLEKKNDVFSGSVKLSGKGDVKVLFKKEDGEYGDLYLYKVI